jgi:hypothetical protein
MNNDAPPHSLKYSNANSKLKTTKERVKVRSLTHNILGVEGCVGAWDGTKMSDKWVNYSHRPAQPKQQVG